MLAQRLVTGRGVPMSRIRSGCLGVAAMAVAGLIPGGSATADGYVRGPVYSAPFSWSGFYVGINGGGGWTTESERVHYTNLFNGNTDTIHGAKADGGFGGGQIGYNWQVDRSIVLGIEADIQGSGIEDKFNTTGVNFPAD